MSEPSWEQSDPTFPYLDEQPAEKPDTRPPDVTCSGGFKLPSISAFMPTGDQLAEILRKAQADGE